MYRCLYIWCFCQVIKSLYPTMNIGGGKNILWDENACISSPNMGLCVNSHFMNDIFQTFDHLKSHKNCSSTLSLWAQTVFFNMAVGNCHIFGGPTRHFVRANFPSYPRFHRIWWQVRVLHNTHNAWVSPQKSIHNSCMGTQFLWVDNLLFWYLNVPAAEDTT